MFAASVPCTKEVMPLYHEIIDTVNLNGVRCHIIYNSVAPSVSVIVAEVSEMQHPVLAVLELERVNGINTLLRIKSFSTASEQKLAGTIVIEPCGLAAALYKALTIKKHITLTGL